MADPTGRTRSSPAARAWNSRLYYTTGGQTEAMAGSETPVACAILERHANPEISH